MRIENYYLKTYLYLKCCLNAAVKSAKQGNLEQAQYLMSQYIILKKNSPNFRHHMTKVQKTLKTAYQKSIKQRLKIISNNMKDKDSFYMNALKTNVDDWTRAIKGTGINLEDCLPA